MASSNELLTTSDVARLLRVHPKQVYRLLKRGLPALRVGEEWRFERERVLAWARATPAQAGAAAAPETFPAPSVLASAMPSLLAANGDCAVEQLLALLQAEHAPLLGLVQTDHAGAAGLLAEGRVLVAGQHEGRSAPEAAAPLPRSARLHLVTRQVGLVHPSARRLRAPSAIVGKRLASRPASAGVRRVLDRALESAGTDLRRAYRDALELASHREVALAVASGRAEVGLTTQAWARAAGLGFLPIGSEAYELLMPAAALGDPRIVALCETAQGQALRRRLRDEFGYDVKHTGELSLR